MSQRTCTSATKTNRLVDLYATKTKLTKQQMDGLKKNFKPILLFTGDIVRPMDESKIPAHQYCQNFAEYVKSLSATKAEEKSSDEESPDDEEKSSDTSG